ncbi:MAG: hypothetical protein ACM3MB_01835, partial [Acidobacteriota bacterium]
MKLPRWTIPGIAAPSTSMLKMTQYSGPVGLTAKPNRRAGVGLNTIILKSRLDIPRHGMLLHIGLFRPPISQGGIFKMGLATFKGGIHPPDKKIL